MKIQWTGAALTGVAALSAALLIYLAADWILSDSTPAQDVMDFGQSAVTVGVIVVGALFAFFKLQTFREFEPQLTVSHTVNHRPIGESHVHVDVSARLLNSSRVKMEIREGFLLVQQVAPTSDEEAEWLVEQLHDDDGSQDFQWPTLDEARLTWENDGLIIEPREAHQELYEFIIPAEVETIGIFTYYYDLRHSQRPRGWGITTIYDIMGRS